MKTTALSLTLTFISAPTLAVPLIYNDFVHAGSDVIDYTVTVTHDTINSHFNVEYKVSNTSPSNVGKLTGFFFDLSSSYSSVNLGLFNDVPASCGQAFGNVNSVNAGGGCNTTLNLNGGVLIDGFDGLFDVGIAWKENDLTDGDAQSFAFADLGLDLSDWGAIGLRGQATGDNGDNSAKEYQLVGYNPTKPPNNQVPEPSILALFSLGLLGMFRFKKQDIG